MSGWVPPRNHECPIPQNRGGSLKSLLDIAGGFSAKLRPRTLRVALEMRGCRQRGGDLSYSCKEGRSNAGRRSPPSKQLKRTLCPSVTKHPVRRSPNWLFSLIEQNFHPLTLCARNADRSDPCPPGWSRWGCGACVCICVCVCARLHVHASVSKGSCTVHDEGGECGRRGLGKGA